MAILAKIALDNVNIIIGKGSQNSILIVDSYINNGYDISFHAGFCNSSKNTRIGSDTGYIYQLY